MTPAGLSIFAKEAARRMGFSAAGVTDVSRLSEGAHLRDWLTRGFQAGMGWMDDAATREDPSRLMAGARSIIVLGAGSRTPGSAVEPGYGSIASFGRFRDYHRVIGRKLQELLGEISGRFSCNGVVAVDSRPVLERALAHRAGLGWPGKSACLVSPDYGPWLLLGILAVDVEMEPDIPMESRCGTCTRCLEACPARALVSPGVVDSRRCISYLTIEHRGEVPGEFRQAIGSRMFGCDECLRACPWGRESASAPFMELRLPASLPLDEVAGLDDGTFHSRFAGTPLMRAGCGRMVRNAGMAALNPAPSGAGALK